MRGGGLARGEERLRGGGAEGEKGVVREEGGQARGRGWGEEGEGESGEDVEAWGGGEGEGVGDRGCLCVVSGGVWGWVEERAYEVGGQFAVDGV